MELFLHYLSLPYLLQGITVTLLVTALGLAGGLYWWGWSSRACN